jgi:hypothetical protein
LGWPHGGVDTFCDCFLDKPPVGQEKPSWDGDRRELRYGGKVAKRFRQGARNQVVILASFEELGWPPRIDDPLPGRAGAVARQRLADAVRRLNQNGDGIRFELDGSGEGIIWSPPQRP